MTWAFRSSRSLELELLGGNFRDRRIESQDALTAELEKASPREVLEWVAAKVTRLAITTSFQSSGLVLLHLLQSMKPGVPVLFLDTGFHFPETLEFRDRVVDMWGLNLVVLRGEHRGPEHQEKIYGPALYRRRPDQCCTINKVEPLQKALDGFDAWISGLRRDQSRLRSGIPVAETQTLPSGHQILKLHPLAGWNKSDVQAYTDAHHIPSHPLVDKGFASIGCWPCTRPVEQGEEERAGRWDGDDKSECGIHTFGNETRESV